MRLAGGAASIAGRAVSSGPGRRLTLGWLLRRRPTSVAELVLISAWVALLALFAGEVLARPGTSGGPLWWCAPGGMPGMTSAVGTSAGRSAAAAIAAGLPMWGLMSSAMMLPAALPAVRHVAGNSLCWRRGRAITEFLAVYLGIWVAYGVLVLGALALLGHVRGRILVILALALAAAWQLTQPKLRALRACHRSSPLPPRGWRASAGVARFGLRNGGACLGSCWAMMLVTAVATSWRLLWMLALTALVGVEKLANRPLRATRRTAALLAGGALGAGLLAVAT
jgi:predicted metal-binding membrane protein